MKANGKRYYKPYYNKFKKFKQLKRSNSSDNLNVVNNVRENVREDVQNVQDVKYSLKLKKFIEDSIEASVERTLNKVDKIIENKVKYAVDQRMYLLSNSDNLFKRGSNEFSIAPDYSHGGTSWLFKYNGTPVATITNSGILYCSNVWINGINILKFISDIIAKENQQDLNFVRHVDLKNGTYEMDIADIIVRESLEVNSTTTNTPVSINASTPDDPRFVNIDIGNIQKAIQVDKYDGSTNIMQMLECVNWGTPWMSMINYRTHLNFFLSYYLNVPWITTNEIAFGYEDLAGDSIVLDWIHDSHDSANNHVQVSFWDKFSNIADIYNDKLLRYVQAICKMSKNTNMLTLQATSQLANGDDSNIILFSDTNNDYTINNCATVSLIHDTQYYGLKFKVITADNTDDNKLCIYPTGVTIDGQLDCYDDVSIWNNLEVSHDVKSNTGHINTLISSYINCTTRMDCPEIKYLTHLDFYDDTLMCIDFKKMIMTYNDRGRMIYEVSGTYNNTLCLDVNKSHKIMVRVYSDGGGLGNTDYFTTLKHEITLLDGDGVTTLKNLTVTDSLNLALQYITQLYTTLTGGQQTTFRFGHGSNIYDSGCLAYCMDSTLANSYIHLYLSGCSGLKVYADKIESVTPLYAPTMYSNGSQVLTAADLTLYARKDQINYFTQNQWIQSTNTTDDSLLILEDQQLLSGKNIYYAIGYKFQNTSNCAYFGYYHDSDSSTSNKLTLGMGNAHNLLTANDTSVNINRKTILNTPQHEEYPFTILVPTLTTNQISKIMLGDGTQYIGVGLVKNSNNDYYGYFKLTSNPMELRIFSNLLAINYSNTQLVTVAQTRTDINNRLFVNYAGNDSNYIYNDYTYTADGQGVYIAKFVNTHMDTYNNTWSSIYIGQSSSRCFELRYTYNTTANSCKGTLYCNGTNIAEVYPNKLISNKMMTVYRNDVTSSTYNHILECLAPNMTSGGSSGISFGKAGTAGNRVLMMYNYSGDNNTNNHLEIGFTNYPHLVNLYLNRLAININTNINHKELTINNGTSTSNPIPYWKFSTNGYLTSINGNGDTVWLLRKDDTHDFGYGNKWIAMGYQESKNRCGFGFRCPGDLDTSNCACIWHDGDKIRCYRDKVTVLAPLDSTYSNSSGCTSNMKNVILDICYPVGCYMLGWKPNIGSWSSRGTIYTSGSGIQTGYTMWQRDS